MIAHTWKLAIPVLAALLPAGLLAQTASPAPANAPASASAKVENQDSFTVVGYTVRTSGDAEAGGQGKIPQLWQQVIMNNTLDSIPHKVGDGMVVVYSDYSKDGTGQYNYTLGVRVSSVDKVPDGMVEKTVPAGKYAIITSAVGPGQEVIPAMWQKIAQMTPAELGGTRAYQIDFETYGPFGDPGAMQSTAHIGLK